MQLYMCTVKPMEYGSYIPVSNQSEVGKTKLLVIYVVVLRAKNY